MPQALDALFVLDPPDRFDPAADSSFVMITEALRRGHRPFGALIEDLSLHADQAMARVAPLVVHPAGADIPGSTPRIELGGSPTRRSLAEFDVVLMRKDPPVDAAFVAATWILDHAKTLVVNAPSGLRELNEKIAIARFGDLAPRTYVTRSSAELRELLDVFGGRMIVKPVYGFGGREILMAREGDPNLGSVLELATAEGKRWTVAQEYLPEAAEGDKRILLVDGEPIGAVLRVPAPGELRNNFHAGGSPAASSLTERDRAICSRVGPVMRDLGQFFVGIDVIGGRLTEINVTSPTGMQEINRLGGLTADATMEARFWAGIESKLGASART
jgi:glutathione synthase